MDAMVIVDMQCGLGQGPPVDDLGGVVCRINLLAAAVRRAGGAIIWIRHCGAAGDTFQPGTPGWDFLPDLDRRPGDIVVSKTLNDPFARTCLSETLARLSPNRILVAGWATDFCVDATIRSAVSLGHAVVAVSDANTLADRPHLDAGSVRRHHLWLWRNLIADPPVRCAQTAELIEELASCSRAGSRPG